MAKTATTPSATALVLSTCPQTLAVMRSLHEAGVHVVLGLAERSALSRSRACDETWLHPPLESESFGSALCTFLASRQDIGCVFPVGEGAVGVVHGMLERIPHHVDVVAVPVDVFALCHDKGSANQAAFAAGIRVPEYAVVHSHDELTSAAENIGFPLIVKSVRTEALVLGRKAYIVRDRDEFLRTFVEWPVPHKDLVVQRYIAGVLAGADFVARGGELVAYYECHVRRTNRLDGTGFAVEFESCAPSEDLFATVRDFVRETGYSGPGLLQCIRCEVSGALYFIENNARLAAGVGDIVATGLDLPLIAFEASTRWGNTARNVLTEPVMSYRLGHRTHWLERDILGWLEQRKQLSWRQSGAWLGRMWQASLRADAHMNWCWRDPMPSLAIYSALLGRVLRGLLASRTGPCEIATDVDSDVEDPSVWCASSDLPTGARFRN